MRVPMGTVLAMEQASMLPHSLPIHNDYTLHPEQDCLSDQFTSHAHHYQPTSAGVVDQLRRDVLLPQSTAASDAFTATNHPHGSRFVPDRGVASDASRYQSGAHFTDSSSGSFSTSPSSAASSLVNTTYPPNHYTGLTSFTAPVLPPQSFVPSPYAGARVPSLSEASTSGMLPPPTRSSIVTLDGTDREAYAHAAAPFLARSHLSSPGQPGFTPYPGTPRTVLSTFSPTLGAYTAMASNTGYGTTQAESLNFPWPNLEVIMDMTCEGQQVTPEVHAKVEKGFFQAPNDLKWTCYRRNYFSVTCNFELHPNIINGRLFLKRNGNNEQVQAMGMRLSAVIDGSNGKSIELIAHTPKRDNGPKNPITVIKVAPTPTSGRAEHSLSPNAVYQLPMATFHATGTVAGVFLPLQHISDPENSPAIIGTPQLSSPTYSGYPTPASSHSQNPAQHISHTFERVQFKSATANNGKRRASQQYFHLVVELFADVRKPESDTPTWVKVAQRVSDKIVVRGRSPSHYQNEGQHTNIGRGGSASGDGYSGSGGGYSVNPGGFRGVNGGSYDGAMGHNISSYRGKQYGMHPGSDGSDSSPDSIEDGAALNDHHADTMMNDADHADFQGSNGYLYYPATAYESIVPQTLPPLAKVDTMARYTTDPRQYAVKTEYADAVPGAQWSVRGCRPFQGVESSRGYYPDLSGGSAGYT